MAQLITERSLTETKVTTFKDREATVWVDERRWVWAPWEVWARVLVIPQPLQAQLLSRIRAGATEQSREWNEPYQLPDSNGRQWFRWHAVEDGLQSWLTGLRGRITKGDASKTLGNLQLSEDEQFLVKNIKALRKWGRDLQERALAGAVAKQQEQGGQLDNTAALAQALVLIAGVQQNHEARLGKIEKSVLRDPEEFIDAKSFVTEQGIATDRLVAGTRLTVQQWLGNQLKMGGADVGPPVQTRIEGTSRVVEVNTYRRGDLLAALDKLPKP